MKQEQYIRDMDGAVMVQNPFGAGAVNAEWLAKWGYGHLTGAKHQANQPHLAQPKTNFLIRKSRYFDPMLARYVSRRDVELVIVE